MCIDVLMVFSRHTQRILSLPVVTSSSMSRTMVFDGLIDAVTWGRNGFTSTTGATAWACKTPAVAKNKVTGSTVCWIEDESSSFVVRDGLHDVGQMFLDLPLRNSQHLCQLMRGQPGLCDRTDDPLTRCLFGRHNDAPS
jgi:hypothetical protein